MRASQAFTLAELLIAMMILGVIATFTIPKVLASQQNGAWNAAGKETIAAIANTYLLHQANQGVSGSTKFGDMTTNLNYVSLVTTGSIDSKQGDSTVSCSSSPCLKLHNGGVLRYTTLPFATTDSTAALEFFFDPDGQVTGGGATNSPGKSINIFLYADGHIVTRANTLPNTQASNQTFASPNAAFDPPWFSW